MTITGRRLWSLVLLLACLGAMVGSVPVARADHGGYTLSVEKEIDHHPLRDIHRMTATVIPPVQGAPVEVNFEIVSGPNAFQTCCDTSDDGTTGSDDRGNPDRSCIVRAAESTCTAEYSDTRASNGEQDQILAWIDHDGTSTGTSEEGLDLDEHHDAGEPPHEPGVKNGSEGSSPEPDSTDVVLVNWGQLEVGQFPFTDGPVEAFELFCDSQRSRTGGGVVGVVNVCTYMVAMDPGAESDDSSDHFALWTQASGKAKGRGWCATRLSVTAKVPADARQTALGALPEADVSARESLTATLTFDADGTASVAGYVEASALAFPRRIRIRTEEGRVTSTWRGATKARLALPVGVAFASPAGSFPDPKDPSDVVLKVERRSC